jgi:hypothetical protein
VVHPFYDRFANRWPRRVAAGYGETNSFDNGVPSFLHLGAYPEHPISVGSETFWGILRL